VPPEIDYAFIKTYMLMTYHQRRMSLTHAAMQFASHSAGLAIQPLNESFPRALSPRRSDIDARAPIISLSIMPPLGIPPTILLSYAAPPVVKILFIADADAELR